MISLRGNGLVAYVALLLLAMASFASVAEEAIQPKLHLFDGNSLAGWRSLGEAHWRVHKGAIEARGDGYGFLVTKEKHGDYQLSLEFWIDSTTNSGIFIGCPDPGNVNPKACYEINIWDQHPRQEARTGSIVLEVMPPLAKINTVGKWNRLKIIKSGSSLRVSFNGHITAVLENARPDSGYIALQHGESGTVRFRKLVLRF